MSGGPNGRSRRGGRNHNEAQYLYKSTLDYETMLLNDSRRGAPPYYPIAQGSAYSEMQPVDSMPYMLPYTTYQQPQQALCQYQLNPAGHRCEAYPQSYVALTPPFKRVRTNQKSINNSHRATEGGRRTPSSQKSTPSKTSTTRRTFSDFRIAKITIGTWTSEECKEDADVRDSKIRFCFRNSADVDPDSTLSASEAALQTPDRLSISVANGTRRIIIPAHHIKHIRFSRRAGKIDIETDGWAAFEVVEPVNSPCNLVQTSAQSAWKLTEDDITDGQLAKVKTIEIDLDQQKPLTEPKWTRGSLSDHIDAQSRFLKILQMTDAEEVPTFEDFLDKWAGTDMDRAYFYEYHLTSERLLKILTALMSSENVLTPSIQFMLESMLSLIKSSEIPEHKLLALLKQGIYMMPKHMLRNALDMLYEDYCLRDQVVADSPLRILISDTQLGGSKRQRGESEVPSEQLARTTLDEKRRRLSESDPLAIIQAPQHIGAKAQSSTRSRSSTRIELYKNTPSRPAIQRSASQQTKTSSSRLTKTQQSPAEDEDGTRMSREEMLRALEDCEDYAVSSDIEAAEQDPPLESSSINLPVRRSSDEAWPAVDTR